MFTYDKNSSRHYNQHCTRQLPNGNIMLFDNGDVRPAADGGHFSRLAEYKLDKSTMVATLVWEFRPKLNGSSVGAYSFHAGAIERLANGHTVGTASCDSTKAGTGCTHIVYEADEQGNEVARATVLKSTSGDDDESQGYSGAAGDPFGYRGLPIKSLGGEFVVKKLL